MIAVPPLSRLRQSRLLMIAKAIQLEPCADQHIYEIVTCGPKLDAVGLRSDGMLFIRDEQVGPRSAKWVHSLAVIRMTGPVTPLPDGVGSRVGWFRNALGEYLVFRFGAPVRGNVVASPSEPPRRSGGKTEASPRSGARTASVEEQPQQPGWLPEGGTPRGSRDNASKQ